MKQGVSDGVKELTSYFRILLSGKSPPIQQVIDCGVVPCLIRFLQFDDDVALQVEAVGAIANIASSDTCNTSDHIRYLIEAGVVPILIRLLSSVSDDVRSQVTWALGNIAGNSEEYRDKVLAAGVIPLLVETAENCTEQSEVTIVSALCSICRVRPIPPLSAIEAALPLLARLLSSQDIRIAEEACSTFEIISATGGNLTIQVILRVGVIPQLIELLKSPSSSMKILLLSAIRTIRNIAASNASHIQLILNYNLLPCLLQLLDHENRDIVKDVCGLISDITHYTAETIQALIEIGFFRKLFKVLKVAEANMHKEAACIVYNTIQYGKAEQVRYLIDEGVILPLCNLLQVNYDLEVVTLAIGGLEKLLHLNNDDYNVLLTVVKVLCEESNGMKAIERLQRHNDNMISNAAKNIIDLIFGKHVISDESRSNQLTSLQYYRKILSIEENPPIQQVIDCGVVPCLIRFLQFDDDVALQVEAVGAIANIASSDTFNTSDHIRYLIEAGVVPILIRLLSSVSDDVRSQAAWALGNIAYDENAQCRVIVRESGALSALLEAAEECAEQSKLDLMRQIAFAVLALAIGPAGIDVRPALPLLSRLLSFNAEEIVDCACNTLCNISLDYIDDVLREDLNIVSKLMVVLVRSTSTIGILQGAVRTLSNIASGDERHTQAIIVTLPSLLWLLDYPDKGIRKDVCRALFNIAAGTRKQIQAMIDAAIFPKLLELMKASDLEVQREAAESVYNAIVGGSEEQVWYLIHEDVIPVLCSLLYDNHLDLLVMEALSKILKVGKKRGRLEDVIHMVLDCNGKEKLTKLRKHKNSEISTCSKDILKTFFL